MKEEVDKDKVIKELLDSMEDEFIKGAEAMLSHLRKDVTGCYDRNDGCAVCQSANKFLKKIKKEVKR